MVDNQFQPADCCAKCPHFDKFKRVCNHEMRQSVIKEIAASDTDQCPVFNQVRAQSMQDLARQLTS